MPAKVEVLFAANLYAIHCRVAVPYVAIPHGSPRLYHGQPGRLQDVHLDLLAGVQRRAGFRAGNSLGPFAGLHAAELLA